MSDISDVSSGGETQTVKSDRPEPKQRGSKTPRSGLWQGLSGDDPQQNRSPNTPRGPARVTPGDTQASKPASSTSQSADNALLRTISSKRAAKHLASKASARRCSTGDSNGEDGLQGPSHRLQPRENLDIAQLQDQMSEVMSQRLKSFQYTPEAAAAMCKVLAVEIRDRVKGLELDRYKIVCVVNIGQKNNQGLRITSRCLWDTNFDKSCTYNWVGGNVFCTATVYGLYHD